MLPEFLSLLVCPVTRTPLRPEIIAHSKKQFSSGEKEIIREAILYAEKDWVYPVIGGIPRLQVEAFLDYESFFEKHLADFATRKKFLLETYPELLKKVIHKNRRTKQSFELEWSLFDYEKDKTWELKDMGLLDRFLAETDETIESLRGKLVFDAGCGNGLLNQFIAATGAVVTGMDFSKSIERAFQQNKEEKAFFLQGDVEFPPVKYEAFDIVHSSGVLICTPDTEHSFSCIDPCVKKEGKMSVWLYHPRKNFIHNLFNFTRRFTSKLPLKFQYHLYRFTIFPVSYVIKRLKGNKQNKREMMISIMDWFSPEYRWEHTPGEAAGWFEKRNYKNVKVTTTDTFGFNIIGVKSLSHINHLLFDLPCIMQQSACLPFYIQIC